MKHNKSHDDPWGAFDEDEYAVPTEVTGADSGDDEESRRRSAEALALRGSGTRGRKKGRGAGGGMPPGMMPAGGAGGAGAPGAGAAPQPAMSQPMMSAGPSGSAGMPSVVPGAQMGLPGAQMGRIGASPYAPAGANVPPVAGGPGAPAPSAGLMAAGTEDSVDADTMREALRRSGLDEHISVDSDGRINTDPLVDTDGDGIPDTPRSQVPGPGDTSPGDSGPGGSGPGDGGPGDSGPGDNSPYPGVDPVPGSPVPGYPTPDPTDPWPRTPSPGNPTPGDPTPGIPDPGDGTYPTPYPVNPVDPVQPAPVTPGYPTPTPTPAPGDGPGGSLPPAPSPSKPGDPGAPYTPPSSPPNSSSPGYRPADFSYDAGELHNEAGRWSDVADRSKPMQKTMKSTPDPSDMFGVMTQVVSPYRTAVETSVEAAGDAGLEAEAHALALGASAQEYQDNEDQAQQHVGGMNA